MATKTVVPVQIAQINVIGEINELTADKFLTEIKAAELIPDVQYVEVVLSTPGGDIYPAMAMHDAILRSPLPIAVIATGQCMSAGVLILQAGQWRLASPNTRFMVHNPSSTMEGSSKELHEAVSEIHCLNIRYKQIVGKRTTLKRKDLSKLMDKESYFWTPMAVKYGLIDSVASPAKKG